MFKSSKRLGGHRGYHPPRFFAADARAMHFSNRRLLLVVAVTTGSVGLLVWWLCWVKGGI